MTKNEAIEKPNMLNDALNEQRFDADESSGALQMAIEALEEIQQYHAIGTPEECRKSVSICKAMIERKLTPENMEEYMKFEDECVKRGFTFSSLLEAREKQTAKKPITYERTNRADCPVCGATVRGINKPFGGWCSYCGQKLDWSDEE